MVCHDSVLHGNYLVDRNIIAEDLQQPGLNSIIWDNSQFNFNSLHLICECRSILAVSAKNEVLS